MGLYSIKNIIVQFSKSPAKIFIPFILGLYVINVGRIDTCTILNIPILENDMYYSPFMPLKRNLNIFSTKARSIFVSIISGHFVFSLIL